MRCDAGNAGRVGKTGLAPFGDCLCKMFANGRVDIFDEARSAFSSAVHSADTNAEVNEGFLENIRIKAREVKTVSKGLFSAQGFCKLLQRRNKCLNNGGTYVGK